MTGGAEHLELRGSFEAACGVAPLCGADHPQRVRGRLLVFPGEGFVVVVPTELDKAKLARIGVPQEGHGSVGVALADGLGERRQFRTLPEAVVVLEHDDLVRERTGRRRVLCPRADDLAEHRPGFDTRQLERVTHEHDCGVRAHGVEEAAHDRQ